MEAIVDTESFDFGKFTKKVKSTETIREIKECISFVSTDGFSADDHEKLLYEFIEKSSLPDGVSLEILLHVPLYVLKKLPSEYKDKIISRYMLNSAGMALIESGTKRLQEGWNALTQVEISGI